MGFNGPVVFVQDARIPDGANGGLEGHVTQVFPQNEGRHGLEHGNFNEFTLLGSSSPVQCKTNGLRCNHASDVVGHHQGHEAGLAAGLLKGARNARCRLNHGVIGRSVEVFPPFAKGQDLGVDQLRIDLLQRGKVQTELGQGLHAHVADEHIRFGQDGVQHLLACGLL